MPGAFNCRCVLTPVEETEPLVPPFTIDVLKNISTEDLAAMRNAPRAVITHVRPEGQPMGHWVDDTEPRNHAVTAASIDVVHRAFFGHPDKIPPAAEWALMQGLAVTEEWCRGWNALRMYLIHPPVSNSND